MQRCHCFTFLFLEKNTKRRTTTSSCPSHSAPAPDRYCPSTLRGVLFEQRSACVLHGSPPFGLTLKRPLLLPPPPPSPRSSATASTTPPRGNHRCSRGVQRGGLTSSELGTAVGILISLAADGDINTRWIISHACSVQEREPHTHTHTHTGRTHAQAWRAQTPRQDPHGCIMPCPTAVAASTSSNTVVMPKSAEAVVEAAAVFEPPVPAVPGP